MHNFTLYRNSLTIVVVTVVVAAGFELEPVFITPPANNPPTIIPPTISKVISVTKTFSVVASIVARG